MAAFKNFFPRPADFVPRPADFNNFIPLPSPPKEPESAEKLEIAKLKETIAVMERSVKLSAKRWKSWQDSVHEVRHLTNLVKEYEYNIKSQQAVHNRELSHQNNVHESERAQWAGQIQQLTTQLESTSQETKDEIEAKHAQVVQNLKTEHDKKMTHLGEEYQKIAQKQRMDHGEKEKELKASHSAEMKEIQKGHKESIAHYAQMRQQMAGAYQNKINELKAMTIKYEEEKKRADALQEFKKKQSQQQYPMIAPRTPNPTQNTPILAPQQQYPITVPSYTNPTQNNHSIPPQQQHTMVVSGATNPTPNNQILPKATNNLKRQQPHGESQVPQNAPIRQRTESYIPVQGSPQFARPGPPNGNGALPASAIQSARNFLLGSKDEVSSRLKQAVKNRAMAMARSGVQNAVIDAVLRDDPETVAAQAKQYYLEIRRRATMNIEDAPAAMGNQVPMGVQNGGAIFAPGNQATMPYNGAGLGQSNAQNGM